MDFSDDNIQRELLKNNKEPHTHCSDCNKSLQNELYHVEQFYARTSLDEETKLIFGYAMCNDCRGGFAKKISAETLNNIEKFKESFSHLQDELLIQLEHPFSDGDFPPIENCTFKGTPINKMKEYQISALFWGQNQAAKAIVYGEDFMKEFEHCLSEETKDELDDFFNRIVDLPPSLKEILEDKVLIF